MSATFPWRVGDTAWDLSVGGGGELQVVGLTESGIPIAKVEFTDAGVLRRYEVSTARLAPVVVPEGTKIRALPMSGAPGSAGAPGSPCTAPFRSKRGEWESPTTTEDIEIVSYPDRCRHCGGWGHQWTFDEDP